ncbi:MAG: hypothetical protein AB8H47_13165 [Bacteroidia bacterium]
MSESFRLSLILLLMLLAGGLLGLLFFRSKQKGQYARQFPWRALMGWCFIWVLERLIVETFELGKLRWALPLVAVLLSFGWYAYVFYQLSNSEDQSKIEDKISQMGKPK